VACNVRQRIEPSQSSDVDSIPIARSIKLIDSIVLTPARTAEEAAKHCVLFLGMFLGICS